MSSHTQCNGISGKLITRFVSLEGTGVSALTVIADGFFVVGGHQGFESFAVYFVKSLVIIVTNRLHRTFHGFFEVIGFFFAIFF